MPLHSLSKPPGRLRRWTSSRTIRSSLSGSGRRWPCGSWSHRSGRTGPCRSWSSWNINCAARFKSRSSSGRPTCATAFANSGSSRPLTRSSEVGEWARAGGTQWPMPPTPPRRCGGGLLPIEGEELHVARIVAPEDGTKGARVAADVRDHLHLEGPAAELAKLIERVDHRADLGQCGHSLKHLAHVVV